MKMSEQVFAAAPAESRSSAGAAPGDNGASASTSSTSTYSSADFYFDSYAGTSVFEALLKDETLNDAYAEAIASADLSGKTVLDVGCGFGQMSFLALKAGARRVVALEKSSEVVAHAKRIAKSNFPDEDVVQSGRLQFVVGQLVSAAGVVNEQTVAEIADALKNRSRITTPSSPSSSSASTCSSGDGRGRRSRSRSRGRAASRAGTTTSCSSTAKNYNLDLPSTAGGGEKIHGADVILSVPFGSCLFFESRLEDLVVARDRFLGRESDGDEFTGVMLPDHVSLRTALLYHDEASNAACGFPNQMRSIYGGLDFSPLYRESLREPTHMLSVTDEMTWSEPATVTELDFYTMTREEARGNFAKEVFLRKWDHANHEMHDTRDFDLVDAVTFWFKADFRKVSVLEVVPKSERTKNSDTNTDYISFSTKDDVKSSFRHSACYFSRPLRLSAASCLRLCLHLSRDTRDRNLYLFIGMMQDINENDEEKISSSSAVPESAPALPMVRSFNMIAV